MKRKKKKKITLKCVVMRNVIDNVTQRLGRLIEAESNRSRSIMRTVILYSPVKVCGQLELPNLTSG